MEKENFFKIIHQYKKSRLGVLTTPHGEVNTPAYVFAGTTANVRTLTPEELEELGVQIIIANTYHLHINPGEDVIKKFQGIHKFMNFERTIMTDSGGFQVFSLGKGRKYGVGKIGSKPEDKPKSINRSLTKITEDGVYFNSHIDGKKMFIGPKESMKIQSDIGADIIFTFDELTSPFDSYEQVKEALKRTNRWQDIALQKFNKKQALFGIIQGGIYEDLRRESAQYVNSQKFSGFGIGGIVGANKLEMGQILDWVLEELDERPKHFLGMGDVDDVFIGVEKGIDLFDCVHPTRLGRRGTVMQKPPLGNSKNKWRYHIKNANNKKSNLPLDKKCTCKVCKTYTRAYIRHLYISKEQLASRLITYHNVAFFTDLMEKIRFSIKDNSFDKLKNSWFD